MFVKEQRFAAGDEIQPSAEPNRLDCLVKLVDHCTAAKEIADSLGDSFLSYMLSMSIQAARSEMRPKILQSHR
jgi:hypothetical protein